MGQKKNLIILENGQLLGNFIPWRATMRIFLLAQTPASSTASQQPAAALQER
ncbi:hypothetical protein [Rhizobium sp. GN54]|uniref:hypothetical protein n=1 Tax=Rhizobium sp. GN54 TaxID=2898150 RepID=UPI001E4AB9FF|nr:hypothetical protein [Rhizobium sp. GN54]MCD2183218.1 hypothetical protein [Rhizobium sp. GN54]